MPDLCFTFLDGREAAIEVKILTGRRIVAGRGQFEAWFGVGAGAHKPTGWVVADEKLTQFFYWSHADMLKFGTKASGSSKDRYVAISLPSMPSMFHSVRHLALHIVRVTP